MFYSMVGEKKPEVLRQRFGEGNIDTVWGHLIDNVGRPEFVVFLLSGENIRGVAEVWKDEGDEAHLAVLVDPDYQRQGVGTGLLEAVINELSWRKVQSLIAEVKKDGSMNALIEKSCDGDVKLGYSILADDGDEVGVGYRRLELFWSLEHEWLDNRVVWNMER